MTFFSGEHGSYNWEIVDGEVRVESKLPGIGVLMTFGPVNPMTTEQAHWAAQGRIDLNRDELARVEQQKAAERRSDGSR